MTTRPITNNDLNSAACGLRMRFMSERELRALYDAHANGEFRELFASKVIAQAALDVAAGKGFRIANWEAF